VSPGEGPARRRDSEISLATRRRLFLVSGAVLAALMTWALAGMPAFGDYHGIYGLLLNRVAVPQEHATNVITAVNFDYRGFDTLGEEFILFAAVLGLALILRERRDEEEGPPDDDAVGRQVSGASVAVRLITVALVGPTVLLAGYIIAHGAITPGGGFQGGVIAATALLFVYLGGEYLALRRIRPLPLVEITKATGALGNTGSIWIPCAAATEATSCTSNSAIVFIAESASMVLVGSSTRMVMAVTILAASFCQIARRMAGTGGDRIDASKRRWRTISSRSLRLSSMCARRSRLWFGELLRTTPGEITELAVSTTAPMIDRRGMARASSPPGSRNDRSGEGVPDAGAPIKYHHGMPFCAKTTDVSGPSIGPIARAKSANWVALTVDMTRSWTPRSAVRSDAVTLWVKRCPPVSTATPFRRITSRVGPRATTQTRLRVSCAKRAARFPPTAPAPKTQIFITRPLFPLLDRSHPP